MGKAALDGLPGVKKVTSGFYRFKEINTVDYDSQQISPQELIDALKKAGTYIGIAKQ